MKIKKDTGFKPLWVNFWEIKHATSKQQMVFLDKTYKTRSKTEKCERPQVYIFEIVLVSNFSLTWQVWVFGPN